MSDTKILDEKYIAHTYGRFPLEIVSGKGSLLYDENGKEYIDMGAGIAVNIFGTADEEWTAAVEAQLKAFSHTSNLFYSAPCAKLAEMLCERTGMEKVFFSNSNRLSMTISFVIMTIAMASREFELGNGVKIGFSSLLVCMMLGTMFCNLSEYSVDIMNRSSKWTSPLYAVFFVLSGAELDLGVFRYPSIILIGVVYILVRCAGKYCGARWSSTMMHCNETVRKYLGITLFPQAGVALGMVVTAQALGDEMGSMIRNIILFSVLVYELVGPQLTRIALTCAGEIKAGAGDAGNRARFEKKAKITKAE